MESTVDLELGSKRNPMVELNPSIQQYSNAFLPSVDGANLL
ncbi:MAG: hypothetical protein ACPG77_14790 [Nannocystaceae bacterium]